ncbi:cytochrome P450 [Mucidula mucida]|nr:cytochrome P450 [Mucidula mucida]
MATSTSLLCVCFLVVFAFKLLKRFHGSKPLPPGPPSAWLFGRIIPEKYPFLQFEEWVKQYGPVFSLKRGSSVVIVIGRYQEAIDLMEKCGAKISDRPRSIAASEIYSGGLRPLLLSNTPTWRIMSRAQHALLQVNQAKIYEPVQLAATKKLILAILNDPDDFIRHSRMFSMTIILTLSHAITKPTFSDYEVQGMIRLGARIGKVLRPGAYLVDAIPILKYLPGYLTDVRGYFKEEHALFKSMMDRVRERIDKEDDAPPCFAKYLLEHQESLGLSDDQLIYLAGTLFGAGAETTASSLVFVIMAAATFPEAAREVQEQIDAVVGTDRCPTFDDRDALPLVTAFVLECARWRPVFVAGMPHCASEDVAWHGYVIPKGAMVIGSHWSIFRDPDVFPNPEVFEPQRWISVDGSVRKDLRDFTFGFGRRACPGSHVANRSLFIATAMILWAFDVLPSGSKSIDTMAFTDTLNIRAEPFEVAFRPRLSTEGIRNALNE